MPLSRSSHAGRPDDAEIHDVVIAGAGPVGLFLALELALHGAAVLVLERAADPDSPLKHLPFGMRGLSAPTLDALDRRGLLDELVAAQGDSDAAHRDAGRTRGAHWARQSPHARQPAGHFAGITFFLDAIDATQWPYRLPGAAGHSLAVTLAVLEGVLARHAIAAGVQIRRGCGVDGFDASDDGVNVRSGHHGFRARWLVGCDGGRSTVRKLGGFDFAGTEPEFTGYSVRAVLDAPNALRQGRQHTPNGMYTFAAPDTISMVEFDGGRCHRMQPITREHVQAVLRRVSGTEVAVTGLLQVATWTDRAFQAAAYRRGCVLLAGDAAHVHSPLGGQGLNLGIGDAINLGWKLAATLRGDAPDGLLDSYATERQPVGASVLDWSRAQVALMRPSPATRALAAVMRDLIDTRDGATYFAGRVWGVTQRYALGEAHPLAGCSAPDLPLADGSRLNARLRGGRGLLVAFGAATGSLRPLARRWPRRLDYVRDETDAPLGLRALLVRPDGIVAWACDTDTDTALDVAAVEQAIVRWFGAPDEPGRQA